MLLKKSLRFVLTNTVMKLCVPSSAPVPLHNSPAGLPVCSCCSCCIAAHAAWSLPSFVTAVRTVSCELPCCSYFRPATAAAWLCSMSAPALAAAPASCRDLLLHTRLRTVLPCQLQPERIVLPTPAASALSSVSGFEMASSPPG